MGPYYFESNENLLYLKNLALSNLGGKNQPTKMQDDNRRLSYRTVGDQIGQV